MWGSFGDNVAPATDQREAAWVESGFDWDLVNCPGFDHYVRIEHAAPGEPEQWGAPVELVAEIARVAADHTSTASEAWYAIWEGHGWAGTSGYWINTDHRSSNPLHKICMAIRVRRFRHAEHRRQMQELRDLDEALSPIPRLELDIRSYYLLTGAVDAAARISAPVQDPGLQMPDLWWPKDRAWFVATDTDLDWTVIGGSERLMTDLLRAFPEQSQAVHSP